MTMKLTEKQIELLKSAKLTNGQNAWEFVQSRPEDVRPWVAKGILSCIAKGYRLDLLMTAEKIIIKYRHRPLIVTVRNHDVRSISLIAHHAVRPVNHFFE